MSEQKQLTEVKCGCTGCNNKATHTWSGHPTCDDCGTRSVRPIPRKAFDVSKVEWSCSSGITDVSVTGDKLGIVTTYTDIGDIYETKQDIINKARALGVTAEDLKIRKENE